MTGPTPRFRPDQARPWAIVLASVVLVTACQGAAGRSASASVAAIATEPPGAAASPTAAPTPTSRPTAEALPTAFPRQNDIPTDGTCETGHACLGLLKAGPYHSELFAPGFSFTMPEAGWTNIGMSPGALGLVKLDAPGDEIAFFRQPKLTKIDGTLDLSAPLTVDGITAWFAAHPDLTGGPATDVTVGPG